MENVNWKNFTEKCLDVAYASFENMTDSNYGEFASYVMDSIKRRAKEIDLPKFTEKTVTPEVNVQEVRPSKHGLKAKIELTKINFKDNVESKEMKPYVKHVIEHGKTKGHTDKSLSDRFEGATVYIGDRHRNGVQDSLAEIVRGYSDRSKDCFKLFKTGETYSVTEYLDKFGVPVTNIARIRFTENPSVSIWMLKNTHYDSITNMDELRNYNR